MRRPQFGRSRWIEWACGRGSAWCDPVALPLEVTVNLPGAHNVLNSLAAIAVATELGVDDAAIARALAGFQGIDRQDAARR